MGRVKEIYSNEPISKVQIYLNSGNVETFSNNEGYFEISGPRIPLGEQILVITRSDYGVKRIPIVIEKGKTVNLDPIYLELDITEVESMIETIMISDSDLESESGSSYNVPALLNANRNVFQSAAAFDFSPTFFRPRGLDGSNGKVFINGLEMNSLIDGRPRWASWGGLNDAQRIREFTSYSGMNDLSFGDLAGTTHFTMRASQYPKGARISLAGANRTYEWRVMGSYHSGVSKKGWAYSILLSKRHGQEGFIEGTNYDANSLFISVEKRVGIRHSLNLAGFYTPNARGMSTAITMEAHTLKGRRYNPNWGYQGGRKRNSRTREIVEPLLMFNHYWRLSDNGASLNTNFSIQLGGSGTTRIDNGGTRRITTEDGQDIFVGGARSPLGNYYQRMPSYFLRDESLSAIDFQNAYLAEQEFIRDGQVNWTHLYEANRVSSEQGGNSIYVVQEDRIDISQFQASSILFIPVSEIVSINSSLNYRSAQIENYAQIKDLLGGIGYLDVDFFAEDENNEVVQDIAQSDLKNPNRIAKEGERYKYNYKILANTISLFGQGIFKLERTDIYLGASLTQTGYQRIGLFENGNFSGARSFGESKQLKFMGFGIKSGAIYRMTGRHILDLQGTYFTKAPPVRSVFSNARQNNDPVSGLKVETLTNLDLSYIYRSPFLKAKLSGFFIEAEDQTEINYYFTENISGIGLEENAFVQEITTGIDTRNVGLEIGLEVNLLPTFKLKSAASFGEYKYTNDPKLYLTSDDFEQALTFGDGNSRLKDYFVAGGPQRAFQMGFEYRDPQFWWFGSTVNYFSNAYLDINYLSRTSNFSSDFDGNTFNDYDPELARELLRQEEFDDYFLVNVVGGKSWKIKQYYVGVFASINNLLDQNYVTGGFEQGRLSNFRDIREDKARNFGRLFGPRYFFGNGTTYFLNVYLRF